MKLLRSILIFPEIYNQHAIQQVREQYDPLASHIRPHISLVFPFDLPITNESLSTTVQQILQDRKSFPVTFNKLGTDNQGYIWLETSYGKDKLTELHDLLYQDPLFKPLLRTDIPFFPHITLGKVDPKIQDNVMVTLPLEKLSFSTYIDTVSIEQILPNQDSDEFSQIELQ